MNIPRKEHPNPLMERSAWENLNGEWEFEIDRNTSGVDREFYKREHFDGKIIIPFCPESKLSGVGDTDFMQSVWYKRNFNIADKSKRVILHIGACDYFTTVYVNGEVAGTHKGGYTPIVLDVTDYVKIGDNTLIVHAEDDVRSGLQPSGKQSDRYHSYGCSYTRTTGIWQTVWLEYVPENFIKSVKYYPDAKNGKLHIKAKVSGKGVLDACALYDGKEVGRANAESRGEFVELTIELSEKHLWEVGNGRLYDLKLNFNNDEVTSYFGLRDCYLDGCKFMINGKSVFQRTVLDQGFYPDGIYTAPSDADLVKDIQMSLDAGFNGARLHEKVFEPRFLYHCDRMGYLVWGEYANWGLNHVSLEALPIMLNEWTEAVERDFNHPAIIGWCPYNETWDLYPHNRVFGSSATPQNNDVIALVYKATKALDPTRPCIDTSGGFHVVTDIYDFHDYDQNAENFKKRFDKLMTDNVLEDCLLETRKKSGRVQYNGEPVFCSEYGGIKWDETDEECWGYGDAPKTKEEFVERYKNLTEAILNNSKIFGFCYTQLYDVEQERNGLYTYARQPKFDMDIFKKINTQIAEIEK